MKIIWTPIGLPRDRESIIAHPKVAFTDERGDITNILDGVDIRHIAFITSKPFTVRGNHFHEWQQQYIYILRGEMLTYSCHKNSPHTIHILRADAGDLLYCPPNVAHAYQALSQGCEFLNIDDDVRNPDTYAEDTTPFKVEFSRR